MVWKFRSIVHIFFYFFCRSCQIQCFLHTVAAILRWSIHLSHIFASNHNKIFPLFGIAVCDSVQKALDLTNPARNRIKLSIIDLSFRQKAWLFVKCKCPNSYSVWCESSRKLSKALLLTYVKIERHSNTRE